MSLNNFKLTRIKLTICHFKLENCLFRQSSWKSFTHVYKCAYTDSNATIMLISLEQSVFKLAYIHLVLSRPSYFYRWSIWLWCHWQRRRWLRFWSTFDDSALNQFHFSHATLSSWADKPVSKNGEVRGNALHHSLFRWLASEHMWLNHSFFFNFRTITFHWVKFWREIKNGS